MTLTKRLTHQDIVYDFPPIYDEIEQAFPAIKGNRAIIFSFGPRIYNPYGVAVGPELLAHEGVHGWRQGETAHETLDWWRRYMNDGEFRLVEELAAHRAEFDWLYRYGNRKERRQALKLVADKLASPIYGSRGHRMVTPARAKKLLQETA